jgi:hypothetical protein
LIELHHVVALEADTAQPGWLRMGWRTSAGEVIEDLIAER